MIPSHVIHSPTRSTNRYVFWEENGQMKVQYRWKRATKYNKNGANPAKIMTKEEARKFWKSLILKGWKHQ